MRLAWADEDGNLSLAQEAVYNFAGHRAHCRDGSACHGATSSSAAGGHGCLAGKITAEARGLVGQRVRVTILFWTQQLLPQFRWGMLRPADADRLVLDHFSHRDGTCTDGRQCVPIDVGALIDLAAA
jgi:hypothetical protein